jgi:hypothetical protein
MPKIPTVAEAGMGRGIQTGGVGQATDATVRSQQQEAGASMIDAAGDLALGVAEMEIKRKRRADSQWAKEAYRTVADSDTQELQKIYDSLPEGKIGLSKQFQAGHMPRLEALRNSAPSSAAREKFDQLYKTYSVEAFRKVESRERTETTKFQLKADKRNIEDEAVGSLENPDVFAATFMADNQAEIIEDSFNEELYTREGADSLNIYNYHQRGEKVLEGFLFSGSEEHLAMGEAILNDEIDQMREQQPHLFVNQMPVFDEAGQPIQKPNGANKSLGLGPLKIMQHMSKQEIFDWKVKFQKARENKLTVSKEDLRRLTRNTRKSLHEGRKVDSREVGTLIKSLLDSDMTPVEKEDLINGLQMASNVNVNTRLKMITHPSQWDEIDQKAQAIAPITSGIKQSESEAVLKSRTTEMLEERENDGMTSVHNSNESIKRLRKAAPGDIASTETYLDSVLALAPGLGAKGRVISKGVNDGSIFDLRFVKAAYDGGKTETEKWMILDEIGRKYGKHRVKFYEDLVHFKVVPAKYKIAARVNDPATATKIIESTGIKGLRQSYKENAGTVNSVFDSPEEIRNEAAKAAEPFTAPLYLNDTEDNRQLARDIVDVVEAQMLLVGIEKKGNFDVGETAVKVANESIFEAFLPVNASGSQFVVDRYYEQPTMAPDGTVSGGGRNDLAALEAAVRAYKTPRGIGRFEPKPAQDFVSDRKKIDNITDPKEIQRRWNEQLAQELVVTHNRDHDHLIFMIRQNGRYIQVRDKNNKPIAIPVDKISTHENAFTREEFNNNRWSREWEQIKINRMKQGPGFR